jgi:hypothetical protein
LSDRLALAEAIEDAGIERTKATRIASVIFNAIHENVATKADVQASEASIRGEMREGFARVEAKFAEASAQADGRFARQDVAIERLRSTTREMESRLLIRIIGPLGSLLVVGFGALFWALQHWPPHP